MKYLSDLSAGVADDGTSGFPSDQLIRNIRVGLHRCGYFRPPDQLFDQPPRDFIGPTKGHPLVHRYRDDRRLLTAIPHADRLIGLPKGPFVGELDYADLAATLGRQLRWFGRAERHVVEKLSDYLEYKLTCRPRLQIESSDSETPPLPFPASSTSTA